MQVDSSTAPHRVAPTPRVAVVMGTRPEGIKTLPLVRALASDPDLDVVTVTTGQHREILRSVMDLFDVVPDHDLDLLAHGQGLSQLFARVLQRVDEVLAEEAPAVVVVQGDTTTSTAAALAAFHRRIPVVHLEAGLRTDTLDNPFPEEANRRLTTRLAVLHCAPTAGSRANLERENVSPEDIVVTGNTVIDALLDVVDRPLRESSPVQTVLDDARAAGSPVLLVTTHRRESWGEPMRRIGQAVAEIARRFPDLQVVLPLHPNPLVREAVTPAVAGLSNVHLAEPLDYHAFVHAMNAATVVLTDSGGVQEEAPSLGKPVLVMRENTERPEAVAAGAARLVGTSVEAIVAGVSELLTSPAAYEAMARAVNPYGDGLASARTVAAIKRLLGVGLRGDTVMVEEFSAQAGGGSAGRAGAGAGAHGAPDQPPLESEAVSGR